MKQSFLDRSHPGTLPFVIKAQLTSDQVRAMNHSHTKLKELKNDEGLCQRL